MRITSRKPVEHSTNDGESNELELDSRKTNGTVIEAAAAKAGDDADDDFDAFFAERTTLS